MPAVDGIALRYEGKQLRVTGSYDDGSRTGQTAFGAADTRLEPGMVINIELPYYELGLGGLQIEETLVIRPDGHELLTTASRDLLRRHAG